MTDRFGRTVTAVGTCAMFVILGGCAASTAAKPPLRAPQNVNSEVASYRRVLVAGFVVAGKSPIDLNEEAARFLRMELRSKGMLQVIEMEPLQLPAAEQTADGSPVRRSAEDIFADVRFWKRLGTEYSEPLILTGTAALRSIAPKYEERQIGPRITRVWLRGVRLDLRLVFISGATGVVIDSVTLPTRTAHAKTGRERELSLFFDLMAATMPTVLSAFGPQTSLVPARRR